MSREEDLYEEDWSQYHEEEDAQYDALGYDFVNGEDECNDYDASDLGFQDMDSADKDQHELPAHNT